MPSEDTGKIIKHIREKHSGAAASKKQSTANPIKAEKIAIAIAELVREENWDAAKILNDRLVQMIEDGVNSSSASMF